jgi:hypothetical protein
MGAQRTHIIFAACSGFLRGCNISLPNPTNFNFKLDIPAKNFLLNVRVLVIIIQRKERDCLCVNFSTLKRMLGVLEHNFARHGAITPGASFSGLEPKSP